MRDWRNLAVVAACVLPLLGFWATGLTDLDEGFYGAVVSHMLRTGDWITPHFNGAPWFEKPILVYWLAAPSVALFGESVGPRLPSVVCTLATAFVLYRFVLRHRGVGPARVVAAAYGGSLLVVALGRMLMTDAPFVLALTLAFTTFYDSLVREPRTRLWTAVALGLAVLAKGPVAGVLFVGVAAVVFWRMPETRTKFRGHWLLGAVLFLAVVATWYVPAYLASGELFVREFLIEQNIGRFAGGDLAHRVPWWSHPVYFPLVLLLAAMPWSFWAARARWFERTGDPFVRYLWVWCLVVVAFFTVSGSKLPHYALPAVAPFVALTVLAVLERREDGATADFWLKGALAWSAVVFAVATPVFMLDYANRFEELHRIARHLREKEGFAVLYGVGRRDRDVEIKLSLNPSAHPSFLFYLRKDGRMTDEPETIVGRKGPVWIVAEQGEMDGELSQLLLLGGRDLVPYDPPFATEKYEVWLAEPR